jgi:hypothetical protein
MAIFRQLRAGARIQFGVNARSLIQGLSCRKSLLDASAAVRLGLPQQLAIF